jgi:hypothetical protein
VRAPVPLGSEDINAAIILGGSFTHDFASQERNVEAFDPVGTFQPFGFPLSTQVEKKNRDRDKASVTGGASVDFGAASLQLSYQHDFGFDERESADIFSAYLRIPL